MELRALILSRLATEVSGYESPSRLEHSKAEVNYQQLQMCAGALQANPPGTEPPMKRPVQQLISFQRLA